MYYKIVCVLQMKLLAFVIFSSLIPLTKIRSERSFRLEKNSAPHGNNLLRCVCFSAFALFTGPAFHQMNAAMVPSSPLSAARQAPRVGRVCSRDIKLPIQHTGKSQEWDEKKWVHFNTVYYVFFFWSSESSFSTFFQTIVNSTEFCLLSWAWSRQLLPCSRCL